MICRKKKVGVTEHPTKIFAEQVTAEQVRALEIHDVAHATSWIACALRLEQNWKWSSKTFPHTLSQLNFGMKLLAVAFVWFLMQTCTEH